MSRRRVTPPAILIPILLVCAVGPAIGGSRLRPNLSYDGKELVLRSSAVKEVTFLKIDVYEVGLYLENVYTLPESIISSPQLKAFVLHFIIDVKSHKLAEAWLNDLRYHCESDCDSLIARSRPIVERLPDIRAGEEVAYILWPDGVDLLVGDTHLGRLEGTEASRAILAAFLGPRASPKLRSRLLN